MSAPNHSAFQFPTWPQALLLVCGLFLLEFLIAAGFYGMRDALGLDFAQISALAVLLANGVVITLVMHWRSLSYREVFHPSPHSARATAGLLLVPVLLTVPVLVCVLSTLVDWLVVLVPMSESEEQMFQELMSSGIATVLSVTVLAPVLEEMLFRGVILQGFLSRYRRWPAILGSAVMFGAAHLNVYQFAVGLFLGIFLGWLYERTRSLIPCIALHGAYNTSLTWVDSLRPESAASGELAVAGWVWLVATLAGAAGAFCLWRLLGGRAALRDQQQPDLPPP